MLNEGVTREELALLLADDDKRPSGKRGFASLAGKWKARFAAESARRESAGGRKKSDSEK